MKIRNGFVSNSSSSSFIIGLKEIPKTPDDLKRILLGDKFDYPVIDGSYNCMPTDIVIDRIYKDIMYIINRNQYTSNIDDMSIFDDFKSEIKYHCEDYEHYIPNHKKDRFNELKSLVEEYNEEEDKLYSEKNTEIRHSKFKSLREKFDGFATELTKMIVDSIMEERKEDKIFFNMNYSDNDGQLDSLIEHGDILLPITILYINQH